MPRNSLSLTIVLCLGSLAVLAYAAESEAIRLDKQVITRWQFGLEVTAVGGQVTGIQATLPVPMDWPEQKVKVIAEDHAKNSKVSYRVLDDSVKQMVVAIPTLASGETDSVLVTYEIEKSWIEAPESTAALRVPKPSRALTKFLGVSPYIETNDLTIKRQSSELINHELTAWDQTKTFFDWVRTNVKYEFAEEIKPATVALKNRVGDCEELSSLFIAFCRQHKIPARAVWVPGHTYPEFCLEDSEGKSHWYPCQAAGAVPDFGRMPEDRPILQKGDSIKIPGEKTPQRYAKQTLAARNAVGTPQVKFIMRPLVAPQH
jgi:Transglutaminase-like superfamily